MACWKGPLGPFTTCLVLSRKPMENKKDVTQKCKRRINGQKKSDNSVKQFIEGNELLIKVNPKNTIVIIIRDLFSDNKCSNETYLEAAATRNGSEQ